MKINIIIETGIIHQLRVIEFNRFEKSEIWLGLSWPAGQASPVQSSPVQDMKPNSLPCADRQAESE